MSGASGPGDNNWSQDFTTRVNRCYREQGTPIDISPAHP